MRGNRFSIGLRVTLAIFTVALFVRSTWAGTHETVLHSFNGTDGQNPTTSLIFDAAGNLFGTTYYGGNPDGGTVFELTPGQGGGWTETVLHSFGRGTDGKHPSGGLVSDAAGNLYGTTAIGGINCTEGGFIGCGTVFELLPREGRGWTEMVLHSFGRDTDGRIPTTSLTFDATGNLYGTTNDGGIHDEGAVFELSRREGGGWAETVLHSFGRGTDGAYPDASALIIDVAGNLYGTTVDGGIHCTENGGAGCGTAFELSPREGAGWTETLLHSFGNGSDGRGPEGGLIFDATGNLYGPTSGGGIHCTENGGLGCGTVFMITP